MLDIVDRIKKGQPLEDSRVELKAEWPEAKKAARRVAGHANAAHGAPILWLIGVDEQRGVVGAEGQELSQWFSKVRAQFEGLAPELTDLNVPVDGLTVVALFFETDRVPFVVKNPAFGTVSGGGPVELEVPWREATSVRSARRSDLIRLLSPPQPAVDAKLLEAELIADAVSGNIRWDLALELYLTTETNHEVIVPHHGYKVFIEDIEEPERRGGDARTPVEDDHHDKGLRRATARQHRAQNLDQRAANQTTHVP